MKKLLLAGGLLSTLWLSSCKDDFEIAAPYKPITVVYGLLSTNDTAHYIRIQKAFMDEKQSAVTMSKIADSNFWQNLDVTVHEINNKNIISSTSLTKVNLKDEGYIKDDPTDSLSFFKEPSYAYKFKKVLNPNYTYRLVIKNNDNGQVDSAEVEVIANNFPYTTLDNPNYVVDLSNPSNTSSRLMLIGTTPTNAKYLQTILTFFYEEENVNTGARVTKSVDWKFPNDWVINNIKENSIFEFSSDYQNLYLLLRSEIPFNPAVNRYVDSISITTYAGGMDLFNFVQISKTQGSGLTSDQVLPKYTNMKGSALGILSSRSFRKREDIPLTNRTIDSLMLSSYTKDLNFKGRSQN